MTDEETPERVTPEQKLASEQVAKATKIVGMTDSDLEDDYKATIKALTVTIEDYKADEADTTETIRLLKLQVEELETKVEEADEMLASTRKDLDSVNDELETLKGDEADEMLASTRKDLDSVNDELETLKGDEE